MTSCCCWRSVTYKICRNKLKIKNHLKCLHSITALYNRVTYREAYNRCWNFLKRWRSMSATKCSVSNLCFSMYLRACRSPRAFHGSLQPDEGAVHHSEISTLPPWHNKPEVKNPRLWGPLWDTLGSMQSSRWGKMLPSPTLSPWDEI